MHLKLQEKNAVMYVGINDFGNEGINATQQYMKNAMVPEQKLQQLMYIMKPTHVLVLSVAYL